MKVLKQWEQLDEYISKLKKNVTNKQFVVKFLEFSNSCLKILRKQDVNVGNLIEALFLILASLKTETHHESIYKMLSRQALWDRPSSQKYFHAGLHDLQPSWKETDVKLLYLLLKLSAIAPPTVDWYRLMLLLTTHDNRKVRHEACVSLQNAEKLERKTSAPLMKHNSSSINQAIGKRLTKLLDDGHSDMLKEALEDMIPIYFTVIVPSMTADSGFLNRLLQVIKKGFEHEDQKLRVSAFFSWGKFVVLLQHFGEREVEKRIDLIVKPMKKTLKNSVVIQSCLTAFWPLIGFLGKKILSEIYLKKVLVPLVKICVDPLSNTKDGKKLMKLKRVTETKLITFASEIIAHLTVPAAVVSTSFHQSILDPLTSPIVELDSLDDGALSVFLPLFTQVFVHAIRLTDTYSILLGVWEHCTTRVCCNLAQAPTSAAQDGVLFRKLLEALDSIHGMKHTDYSPSFVFQLISSFTSCPGKIMNSSEYNHENGASLSLRVTPIKHLLFMLLSEPILSHDAAGFHQQWMDLVKHWIAMGMKDGGDKMINFASEVLNIMSSRDNTKYILVWNIVANHIMQLYSQKCLYLKKSAPNEEDDEVYCFFYQMFTFPLLFATPLVLSNIGEDYVSNCQQSYAKLYTDMSTTSMLSIDDVIKLQSELLSNASLKVVMKDIPSKDEDEAFAYYLSFYRPIVSGIEMNRLLDKSTKLTKVLNKSIFSLDGDDRFFQLGMFCLYNLAMKVDGKDDLEVFMTKFHQLVVRGSNKKFMRKLKENGCDNLHEILRRKAAEYGVYLKNIKVNAQQKESWQNFLTCIDCDLIKYPEDVRLQDEIKCASEFSELIQTQDTEPGSAEKVVVADANPSPPPCDDDGVSSAIEEQLNSSVTRRRKRKRVQETDEEPSSPPPQAPCDDDDVSIVTAAADDGGDDVTSADTAVVNSVQMSPLLNITKRRKRKSTKASRARAIKKRRLMLLEKQLAAADTSPAEAAGPSTEVAESEAAAETLMEAAQVETPSAAEISTPPPVATESPVPPVEEALAVHSITLPESSDDDMPLSKLNHNSNNSNKVSKKKQQQQQQARKRRKLDSTTDEDADKSLSQVMLEIKAASPPSVSVATRMLDENLNVETEKESSEEQEEMNESPPAGCNLDTSPDEEEDPECTQEVEKYPEDAQVEENPEYAPDMKEDRETSQEVEVDEDAQTTREVDPETTQEVEGSEAVQEVDEDAETTQVEDPETTQEVEDDSETTQEVEDPETTQEVEDDSETTQEVEDPETTQEVEDDSETTQEVEDPETTQEVEDDSETTQEVEDPETTQEVDDSETTQEVEDPETTQKVEDSETAQIVQEDPETNQEVEDDPETTKEVEEPEAAQKVDENLKVTLVKENVDAEDNAGDSSGEEVGGRDFTSQVDEQLLEESMISVIDLTSGDESDEKDTGPTRPAESDVDVSTVEQRDVASSREGIEIIVESEQLPEVPNAEEENKLQSFLDEDKQVDSPPVDGSTSVVIDLTTDDEEAMETSVEGEKELETTTETSTEENETELETTAEEGDDLDISDIPTEEESGMETSVEAAKDPGEDGKDADVFTGGNKDVESCDAEMNAPTSSAVSSKVREDLDATLNMDEDEDNCVKDAMDHAKEVGNTADQVKEANASVDQAEETDASVDQAEEADASVDQAEETDASVDQAEETDASVDQAEETDASVDQAEETDASMDQAEETDASMDQAEETDASVDQAEEADASVDQAEEADASVDTTADQIKDPDFSVDTSVGQASDVDTSSEQVKEVETFVDQVKNDKLPSSSTIVAPPPTASAVTYDECSSPISNRSSKLLQPMHSSPVVTGIPMRSCSLTYPKKSLLKRTSLFSDRDSPSKKVKGVTFNSSFDHTKEYVRDNSDTPMRPTSSAVIRKRGSPSSRSSVRQSSSSRELVFATRGEQMVGKALANRSEQLTGKRMGSGAQSEAKRREISQTMAKTRELRAQLRAIYDPKHLESMSASDLAQILLVVHPSCAVSRALAKKLAKNSSS